jgi:hypothetical protein
LGTVPADAEVIEMGALDAGADEIGLGVDDLDGPSPVVVFASLAGFVGEVALDYLECPQGIAPKILVVAYFASGLQDAGEEFFDSAAVLDRVQQHSDDVMNAGQLPRDAGAELWIARFNGMADGGVVGIGEERIISGLYDHQWAGDFGDRARGPDRVKIGVGYPFCQAISIILKKWAGGSEAVGVEGGGGVEIGEGAFEDDGPEIVAQDRGRGGSGGTEADAEEEDLAGFGRAGGFGLIEDLIYIVSLPIAGGGISAAAFAVGAEVDGKDVEPERTEQWRPGDAADFGIGIAVEDDGTPAARIRGGNPPAGDSQWGVFGFVDHIKGDILEFHSQVGGREAVEEDHGAGIGHAARAEEHSGHDQDHCAAEGDADAEHHQGEDHEPVKHKRIINSEKGN